MKHRTIRLSDLADMLQLSASTVSRALRDHPRISAATKARVQQLAAQMNYRPDPLAQGLITRQVNAIGVIVPDISYHFYAKAISGMEGVAEQRDYNIIICQSKESLEREIRLVQDLINSRVAGFIISPSSSTDRFDHFIRIKALGIPLVFFNRECSGVASDNVVIDNRKVTAEVVDHLWMLGCRRIAFLAGPVEVPISNKRLDGYRQALRIRGIPETQFQIVHTEFNPAAAANAARHLLYRADPPDALIAFSDQLALQAMQVAKERGLHIPGDLCVVGFNDEPVDRLVAPSLSSVHQPAQEIGATAVELLFGQMQHENTFRRPQTVVLHSELMVRESTNRQQG